MLINKNKCKSTLKYVFFPVLYFYQWTEMLKGDKYVNMLTVFYFKCVAHWF